MRIEIDRFITRTETSRIQLAKDLGVTTSNLTYWASGKNYPSSKYIELLIDKGITINELFGVELGQKLLNNSHVQKNIVSMFSTAEFKDGVREALNEILNEKKKG